MDQRVEKLAYKIVHYSCDVQPGEKVVIECHGDHNFEFVKALIREIYAVGASPFLITFKMDVLREIILNCNEEQLAIWAEADGKLMESMNVYIRVRGEENTCELGDVPAEKMSMYSRLYYKKFHEHRIKCHKSCVMHYPTIGMAQGERMSMDQLEEKFFKICTMDYAKMEEAYQPLKKLMEKTDKVHIIGEGTNLIFSIKGMPAVPCAGRVNIPDGEIFCGPIIDSINGNITYNTTGYYDGVAFEHIKFTFKNGRIVEATSNDTERLNQILDRDPGSRSIGEFAIGVNPYVTKPWTDSMFNEKMTGSIHLTPGNSISDSDNGNRSSIHWDLVYAQTPECGGGEIYFDDILIRKDGRFVLDELKGLNPENLR